MSGNELCSEQTLSPVSYSAPHWPLPIRPLLLRSLLDYPSNVFNTIQIEGVYAHHMPLQLQQLLHC
jgi:hypothetical protein